MRKYLAIDHVQIYFAPLLITLNVSLRIGKCTPGGTCSTGWEPVVYMVIIKVYYSFKNTLKILPVFNNLCSIISNS